MPGSHSLWRIRRTTHMQMAEIVECRLIFLAHPARKIRIIQPLIPGGLRHILQHSQPLLNCLPAVWRHLPPLREHVVANMIPLLRSHPLPNLRSVAQFLLLRRRQIPQPLFVLENFLPLLRRHIAPALLRIGLGSSASPAIGVITRRVLSSPSIRGTITALVLRVRRRPLLPVLFTGMLRRHNTRHRQCSHQPQFAQNPTELASQFHLTYICSFVSGCC
jgi:hypothetical protein